MTTTSQATSYFFFQNSDQSDYFKNDLIRILRIFYTSGLQLGMILPPNRTFGDVIFGCHDWGCVCVCVCVCMLLASSSWRSRMLLNILQHTRQPHNKELSNLKCQECPDAEPLLQTKSNLLFKLKLLQWLFNLLDIIYQSAAKQDILGFKRACLVFRHNLQRGSQLTSSYCYNWVGAKKWWPGYWDSSPSLSVTCPVVLQIT